MTQSSRLFLASALVALLLLAAPGQAQQEPTPEELQALVARVMKLGKPGPEHARLARMAGTFDVENKIWPTPGAEPETAHGTMESEMVLGGRFLLLRSTIEGGMFAAEGLTIIGFDRRHEEYTLIGMDTTGTYWVAGQGPADADGTSATLSGTDDDPVIGHTQEYDFVLHFVDDDTIVTDIVFKDSVHTQGGPPFRMVQSTARRRK